MLFDGCSTAEDSCHPSSSGESNFLEKQLFVALESSWFLDPEDGVEHLNNTGAELSSAVLWPQARSEDGMEIST